MEPYREVRLWQCESSPSYLDQETHRHFRVHLDISSNLQAGLETNTLDARGAVDRGIEQSQALFIHVDGREILVEVLVELVDVFRDFLCLVHADPDNFSNLLASVNDLKRV